VSRRRYPRAVGRGELDPRARRQARVRMAIRVILAAGFAAAVIAFVDARQRPENPLGYDPLQTKQYRHDLEVYGGRANVIAAEFRDWFEGLWYGRNLAYTIAVLTILLALAVRFFGTPTDVSEEDAEDAGGSPAPP
jgi:hypothetical protein